jgi:N4-(beta-N-acetylglucosaminyl)-L-asparaginase
LVFLRATTRGLNSPHDQITRRTFVATTVGAAAVVRAQGPTVITRGPAKPAVVSSANGNRFKNGGSVTGVEKAFTMMASEGTDVLDALIAGVNIVELDPLDDSVGYGGLPNAEGIVQLDSSCMHGPKKRAGAVAAIEGVRTPSLVAKAVMEMTDYTCWSARGCRSSRATWASPSKTI